MQMTRYAELARRRVWLLAALCATAAGCSESGSSGSQVLTGRIRTSGALAVRAVTGDAVLTAATVRSDGTFTLALPAGKTYRLEVLTTSGVRHVLGGGGGSFTALAFTVCQPVDPYDVGGIGDGTMPGGGGGGGGTNCDPGDPDCKPCDPMDPSCAPPPPCDPSTGVMCDPCADPTAPNCPCDGDPANPNCMPPPPPCDPMTDPSCQPDPCADPTSPNCCMPDASGTCQPPCDPGDPSCGTVCTDPMDPNCMPPPPPCMDPADPYCKCSATGACPPPTCNAGDPMCPPPPPPPCMDPTDPNTCDDPCKADPVTCGCASTDPMCWPQPQPPDCDAAGMCDPGTGGMTPDNPPGDFGCKEMPL